MSDTNVNRININLRAHEPSLSDTAVDTLVQALKEENVEFVITLLDADGDADVRTVGASVTIFDNLDKIGRNHLMAHLATIDFTKNVHASITLG